ncbi:MAG: isoleucine--tRNA ligase [Coprobacillus sp.]|nr:isoleucine--tRNA ligase [Coprobacillus sp.]
MDYKDTLLMNKTGFEMRGNLPSKEPVLVKKWLDENLYSLMMEKRKGCEEYVLHDGPPYANGDMHCGHMLNRVLKDITIRYKNMCGYSTPFKFGWDTHGLPIENKVTASGINRKTTPIVEFRDKCKDYALLQVETQKKEIQRLGVVGDYKDPYLTLLKEYEASQLECFKKMAMDGLIYKGLKPVYWSPSSESALAEAEIEYKDVESHSIYVSFDVTDGKGVLKRGDKIVIWTTTPWTIPANLAISAHPDFEYGLYKTSKGRICFLTDFKDKLTEELELGRVKLVKTFKGKDIEYVTCKHPLYDRESLVIVGTHVTSDAGTGFVHTAPGHGMDDFVVCRKYGIEAYCPVDERGYYDESVGVELAGLFYEDANEKVLQMLSDSGHLLKHSVFTHSYPHDWRTGKPLIFRATSQWFCSIEPIRDKLLSEVHEVKWYPSWGETRMVNMIKDRDDWCISRQRAWGVPIPIIYCEDGTPIIEEKVFDHIISLVRENGSNIWYELEPVDLLPKGYKNEHSPSGKFTKEVDIMDVWFDSGSSFNYSIVKQGNKFPVDLYLEGSDQYRGWFNSSLIVSTAVYGHAPYKNVVTHGFVMDEKWEKMSKSKGNGTDPLKIIDMYGSDVLRLYVASVDYQSDVRLSEDIIKNDSEIYRKIRNTLKFMSWNLADYDPSWPKEKLSTMDEYILNRLSYVVREVRKYFDKFDYANGVSLISTFLSTDLSSFYLDISKDTLYCDDISSPKRRATQEVIYQISETVLRLLNPVLPFTMDEFNKSLPGKREEYVQLLDYPVAGKVDEEMLKDYESFKSARSDILKALENARNASLIGSSQEAEVNIFIKDSNIKRIFDKIGSDSLAPLFVVSSLKVSDAPIEGEEYNSLVVNVRRHEGKFCSRCWNYDYDAIEVGGEEYLCPRCKKVMEKR